MERRGAGVVEGCTESNSCRFSQACEIARTKADSRLERITLGPGEALEIEYEAATVYYIERGFVCIEDRQEDGEPSYLSFNGSGEAINLLQVFAATRSRYRMTALSHTSLCRITFSVSLDQSEISDILLDTVDNLSLNMESALSCIWMLYGHSVGERIRRLLAHAARFLEPEEGGLVSLMLSQSQLARAVRAERASVAKELKALEKDGDLRVVYGGLQFDPDKVPRNPIVA